MAKVHVLSMTSHGHFNALVHFPVPVGNNSANVSWKTAALAEGIIGNEAHPAADEAEKPDIEAGDIVELQTVLCVDPTGMTGPEITALVDQRAENAKAAWITAQQVALKYYGYKQGEVS